MDFESGSKLETIILRDNELATVVSTATIVVALLCAVMYFIGFAGLLLLPFGLIVVVIAVIGYLKTRNHAEKVEVFENGIRIEAPAWKKIIVWNEVVGVQLSQVSDVYVKPKYSVPVLIPIGFLSFWGSIRRSGKPRLMHECQYVFHFADKTEFELEGDWRLFGIVSEVKTKVFARVVPDMLKRFRAGEPIPLTSALSYSKTGITGTLVRKTQHSRREIPLDLDWGDIKMLYRTDRTVRITPYTGQTIVFAMGDIINAPAFLEIMRNLSDEGTVPSIAH